MLPSSNALFVFDAAARNGSFTAAAAELNVTQPAVSPDAGSVRGLSRRPPVRSQGGTRGAHGGRRTLVSPRARRLSQHRKRAGRDRAPPQGHRDGDTVGLLRLHHALADAAHRQAAEAISSGRFAFSADLRRAARTGGKCRPRHALPRSRRTVIRRHAGDEGGHAADVQPCLSRRNRSRRGQHHHSARRDAGRLGRGLRIASHPGAAVWPRR
ncbi:hypothetical protein ACVWZV_003487 [Bradyrhizobium sp. GM5.1]